MKLIAQNSVLINAAMRKQTDSSKVAEKWLAHNATKAVTPEDVQSAKSWVKINVQMDSIPLKNALKKVYGSSWAFGATDAKNEISSEIGFDWDEWEPGREAAAVLADAPRGLRTMLDRRGATIKGIDDTTLDRIGSSLALSLSQGLGAEETANMIDYILDDPARSMVIARTETADALVQANVAEYKDNDIAQIEWLVGDPCDICAENAGQIVDIGEEFSSGDQYPPAHPNCVCDVSPVVRFSPDSEDVELAISPDAIKEEGYKANAGMKAAAQRAIDWRAEGHKGGTQVGATRARQIVSGEAMSADTVKRMYSFFSRHEVDKKATGFNSGEEGYPSKGRVAWDLWGGNAGFTWSRQIVERLKRDESKSADSDLNKYDPDQPRDANGRWGSGGADVPEVPDTGDNISSPHTENLQNLWGTVITRTADGRGGDVADSIAETAGTETTSAVAIEQWANNADVRSAVKETVANDLMQQEVLAAVPTQDLLLAAAGGFGNAIGSNGEATPRAAAIDDDWASALETQPEQTYINDEGEYVGITVVELNAQGEIYAHDYTDVVTDLGGEVGVTPYEVQESLNQTYFDSSSRFAIAGTPEAEALVRETAVSTLVNQWAQTSNNNNPNSQAMQQAAAQQFGLDNHAEWEGMTGDLKAATDAAYAQNGAVYSAFLQAQYDNTQNQLKSAGIESITVYRGSTLGDPSVNEVITRPMSSWSTSFGTAVGFGNNGVIYRTEIPASQIMSTAGTGFGCLNEFEIVALGGTYAVDGLSTATIANTGAMYQSEATDGSYQEDGELIDQLFQNAKV